MFDLEEGAPPADISMNASDEMPPVMESTINRPTLRFHAHEGMHFWHQLLPSRFSSH